jgi:thiamine-phosphate pyrophosphorylase
MRVIDAAANRAREGLRVVEDYVRFVLDDKFLTGSLKSLRHELTALLLPLPAGERLAARETLADVGTQVTTAAERRRDRAADVLEANFARLQESLRSLEEFVKILDPVVSAGLKQLRYQTYTLHRAVEATRVGLERLQHARLYVLIDGRRTLEEFRELAQSLAASGVHVIQLRDKQLDDRALVGRARALREIAAGAGVVFVMNDRPDVAVLSRADGVHVGQEELSVKDARAIVGPDAIIGVSTHTIQQARKAVLDGANYIGVGPTFPSETKQFDRFPGVELLRAVAAEIRLPAFAVGGIRAENIPLVLQTGLQRVAVSAAIAGAEDPASAVGAMFAALTPKTDFGCRPPL